MNWSESQIEIFNTYTKEDCNIAIKAGPGSGKTTVLRQLCKLTPRSCKSIFLAFNKSIVEELQSKLPSGVEVSTLHSLGCRSLYWEYGNVKVVPSKTFGVLKKLESKHMKEDLKGIKNPNYYLYNLTQLYDVYRMNLLTNPEEVESYSYKYSLDWDSMVLKHLTLLVDTMSKVNRFRGSTFEIDYVDMIYLPIIKNFNLPRYDRVFVDESQDLNLCQHKLIDRLLGRSSKLITVGDENQCIYSFLGASPDSFRTLSQRENTKLLSLPITYRCPRKVVELVNTVYDCVKLPDTAIDGEVLFDGDWRDIEVGDMVLCRNNKPLLQLYFKLLSIGKRSYIRGQEYGVGIVKLIEPYKNYTIEHCIEELYIQLEELESKLVEQGVTNPRKSTSYIRLSDNIELIKIISIKYTGVSEILPIVTDIFKDKGEGVLLSTIHKAKGLEADNVFLLDRGLIPSKYAEQAWEKEQEKKLLFVAYSRPKKKLIFINS